MTERERRDAAVRAGKTVYLTNGRKHRLPKEKPARATYKPPKAKDKPEV